MDIHLVSDALLAPEDAKVFPRGHPSIEGSFRTRTISPLTLQVMYKTVRLTKAALIPSDGLERDRERKRGTRTLNFPVEELTILDQMMENH